MKKKNIVNLIRCYADQNDSGFRTEAEEIAKSFDNDGDYELAEYIMTLLSGNNVFMPQIDDTKEAMFEKVELKNENLWLPDAIMCDMKGIVNAISNKTGVNKFLFVGKPGTGKTQAVIQLARILNRDVYMVNFAAVVDSKLGNTAKNIVDLFREIDGFQRPDKLIILFDEIDAIALDRTNGMDHREMGRATSTIIKELDRLREDIILIATTNLYKYFDKALIRRFDATIDFDRYSRQELYDIAEQYLNIYLKKFHVEDREVRLFRKIISEKAEMPSPAEIQNAIRTAIVFCDQNSQGDYLRRLYTIFLEREIDDVAELKRKGYTVREIGVLTGQSKSTVDRQLKQIGS